MRSTIKQHGGECGIAREAKHWRYPIIFSGPGSSTIRVRNPANENNQYVDPKKIPLLSIKQSATTIRMSGRATRGCYGIEPPS
jgi:hypothetical protein